MPSEDGCGMTAWNPSSLADTTPILRAMNLQGCESGEAGWSRMVVLSPNPTSGPPTPIAFCLTASLFRVAALKRLLPPFTGVTATGVGGATAAIQLALEVADVGRIFWRQFSHAGGQRSRIGPSAVNFHTRKGLAP